MIITLLINFVLLLIGGLASFLPVVQLPDSVRNVLILAVSYWNNFLGDFPFAVLPWHIFLYVIIPFEVTLLIAKFFFGHILPANTN